MIEQLAALARLTGTAVVLLAGSAAHSALTAAGLLLVLSLAVSVGLAVLVVAARRLGGLAARVAPPAGGARRSEPQLSSLPDQSNPAARGHSRPRAPGRPIPVA